jgi:hypothetical protein
MVDDDTPQQKSRALRELFVETTGERAITLPQDPETGKRVAPDDGSSDEVGLPKDPVNDGLEDAIGDLNPG